MYTSCLRFTSPKQFAPDLTCWNKAWAATLTLFQKYVCKPCVYLTVEQALLEAKLGKSPGYPWELKYSTKAEVMKDPVFQEYYSDFSRSLDTDDPYPIIASANMKKELLKPEKADTVRIVFALPFEEFIEITRLFNGIKKQLINNVTQTVLGNFGPSIGMTPFFGTFNVLANSFFGLKCVEMDGRSWETAFDYNVFEMMWQFFYKLSKYPATFKKRIRNIFIAIRTCLATFPGGSIMILDEFLKSGSGLTSMMGTIYTIVTILYGVFRQKPDISVHEVLSLLCILAFGDDAVIGMPKHLEFDIMTFVIGNLADLDILYKYSNFQLITECTWLNCTFVKTGGVWQPSLSGLKAINSLSKISATSLVNTMERVVSIRNCAYGNRVLFNYVDGFVHFLHDKYSIPYPASYMSLQSLDYLFTGGLVCTDMYTLVPADWEGVLHT